MLPRLAARIDLWAAKRADHYPDRNPKLIILLLATALSLLTVAFGNAGATDLAHPLLARWSAGVLSLGCFICIGGQVIPWRDQGYALEVAGCVVLGSGCFLYAAFAGIGPTVPARAALTYGLGVGSFARMVQIGLYARGRVLRRRALGE